MSRSIRKIAGPEEGDSFCGFELEDQIGSGALSRVFVARQIELGKRQIILKVCIRGDREANLLGQLEFDGIAPIHSIHTDPKTDLTAICMPYLTRVTMHSLMEILKTPSEVPDKVNGAKTHDLIHKLNVLGGFECPESQTKINVSNPLACRKDDEFSTLILKWGIQLAHALDYAHEQGVLHCDVKPGNVLLLPNLSASLLDFNLASADGESIRWTGGTLPYMASEQLQFLIRTFHSDSPHEDLPSVTAQTDVFGLCATLWHLITGQPPFGTAADGVTRSGSASALLDRQRDGIAPDLIALAEKVLPGKAVDVLIKGLSLTPEDRPATGAELAAQLQACLPKRKSRSALKWVGILAVVMGSLLFLADSESRILDRSVQFIEQKRIQGSSG